MATHNINLQLTTKQLIHLNEAMNDSLDCNSDALDSAGFESQRPSLLAQCDALQVFINTLQEKLSEVNHA